MKTLSSASLQLNQKTSKRISIADSAKGLLVLLFFITHAYSFTNHDFTVPMWMQHSGETAGYLTWGFFNFTLMDLGPVAFFFFIGLTLVKAFSRHVEMIGEKAAFRQYFYKNAAFFGAFVAGTYVRNKLLKMDMDWENLWSIGFTGVLMLPFLIKYIRNNKWLRLAAGAIILTLYHYFKRQIDVLKGDGGGMAACVGFLGVVLVASFLQELSEKNFFIYIAASILLFFTAWAVRSFWELPFYREYNSSYMIMSVFVLNCVYLPFVVLDKLVLKNRPIPILAAFGRNIFFFLILTFSFDGVYMLLEHVNPSYSMSNAQYALFMVFSLIFYFGVALFLEKKKIVLKF